MIKTVLILLTGVVSVSFSAIFIRFCHDMPAVTIAAYRLVIASVVIFLIAGFRKIRFPEMSGKEWLLGIAGGVFLAFHFIFWISSLKMTSVASSVALVTTNPIFVGLFSFIIFREKQSVKLIIGIVLSVFGSLVLAAGDGGGWQNLFQGGSDPLTGDLLALGGAVMGSGYLITGSIMREKIDTFRYIMIVYPVSAFVLCVAVFAGGYQTSGFSPESYGSVVMLALVSQLLGHTSFNWALKHIKASMVAISILGEPIGASILAYLFFSETVTLTQLTGMTLIFSAILIASGKGRKIQIDDVAG